MAWSGRDRNPHLLRSLGIFGLFVIGAGIGWISQDSSQVRRVVVGCSGGVRPSGVNPLPCIQPPPVIVPVDPVAVVAFAILGGFLAVAVGYLLVFAGRSVWELRGTRR